MPVNISEFASDNYIETNNQLSKEHAHGSAFFKNLLKIGKDSDMKIESSTVAMASSHSFHSFTFVESMTVNAKASADLPGAILQLSQDGQRKSYLDDMKAYEKEKKAEQKKREEESQKRPMQQYLERSRKAEKTSNDGVEMSDQYQLKLELIKRMFEMLKRGKSLSKKDIRKMKQDGVLDLRSDAFKRSWSADTSLMTESAVSKSQVSNDKPIPEGNSTLWTRVTATSGFYDELESTSFSTTGVVQTKDGRSISFGVEMTMSRAFMCEINTLSSENYVMCDPLVINMDTDMASVTDQKFFFDLDSDGKEEEISFAGKGSGFLALDRNRDGKINDGSELFGTKSGDGFADLAKYDEDGNGWIDENDDVFHQLQIWTKDENGNDALMDLKKADVGAIYLGNADTEFQLKDDAHKTNGAIRKTGIFLRESTGQVGTVNHVDLAI